MDEIILDPWGRPLVPTDAAAHDEEVARAEAFWTVYRAATRLEAMGGKRALLAAEYLRRMANESFEAESVAA